MNSTVPAAQSLAYANMVPQACESRRCGVQGTHRISQWPLAGRFPCGQSETGQEAEIMSVCPSGLTLFL